MHMLALPAVFMHSSVAMTIIIDSPSLSDAACRCASTISSPLLRPLGLSLSSECLSTAPLILVSWVITMAGAAKNVCQLAVLTAPSTSLNVVSFDTWVPSSAADGHSVRSTPSTFAIPTSTYVVRVLLRLRRPCHLIMQHIRLTVAVPTPTHTFYGCMP